MQEIRSQLAAMRRYYDSGATRTYSFRKERLLRLKAAVEQYEQKIYEALYKDLRKSREECWVTENGFFLAELNETLRNLRRWMEAQPVHTNLVNLPSSSRIMREPLGVVMIIGPWNYPFQLLLTPLLGAIAAGNCVVVKPSEFAPATAKVMQAIIESVFEKDHVFCTPGDGATVVPALMERFRFDHVFYTGSAGVGKLIYKMAAEQLTPVTLELGGKSPCVVESDANINISAKRIVMTKFSNAGQMCVAPDYVLVHISQKENLVKALREKILLFFGRNPSTHENYGRLINRKQFDRVAAYISQGEVLHGGSYHADDLYIEPTILSNVNLEAPVMTEEIFGPVLPVISFQTKEEALAIIARNPNPLAFYIFTASGDAEKFWLDAVPSGGACVNNASWHLTNPALPFGGRGFSGMGAYHGYYSFDTFSHKKSVLKTPTWFDPFIKYPPLKGRLKLFKWLIK